LRIEVAARFDAVCLLKCGDGLLQVRSGPAVDLARREAGTIEQNFRLYDRGGIRSSRAALAGRRGDLRRVDCLRVERWGALGAACREPPRRFAASAGSASIRMATAQMSAAANALPGPIDQEEAPSSPMRPMNRMQMRSFAPGATAPWTTASIPIFFSCPVGGLRAELREAAAALLEAA
jgi:hypothetical protein